MVHLNPCREELTQIHDFVCAPWELLKLHLQSGPRLAFQLFRPIYSHISNRHANLICLKLEIWFLPNPTCSYAFQFSTHQHSSNCSGQSLQNHLWFLSFSHISLTSLSQPPKKLYSQNIFRIWPLLAHSNATTLTQATTISHLDHYNSSWPLPIAALSPLHSIFTKHLEWSWNPTAENTSNATQGITIKALQDLAPLVSPHGPPYCQAWSCPVSLHLLFSLKNSSLQIPSWHASAFYSGLCSNITLS